jgi:hypothetical protein
MDFTDPQEAQRLQERYAGMTDDELEAVADDGYELTETAQQILQSEIRQRRLDIRLKDKPVTETYPEVDPLPVNPSAEDFDPSDLGLTIFRRVWDRTEATEVKRILNDSGVPCYLGTDNLEDVSTFNIDFDKGVELKVRYIDQPRAIQAIIHSENSGTESEPDLAEAFVRCPKCHSTEIVFESRDSQSGVDPDFYAKFHWSCDACGHKWMDDGMEQEA